MQDLLTRQVYGVVSSASFDANSIFFARATRRITQSDRLQERAVSVTVFDMGLIGRLVCAHSDRSDIIALGFLVSSKDADHVCRTVSRCVLSDRTKLKNDLCRINSSRRTTHNNVVLVEASLDIDGLSIHRRQRFKDRITPVDDGAVIGTAEDFDRVFRRCAADKLSRVEVQNVGVAAAAVNSVDIVANNPTDRIRARTTDHGVLIVSTNEEVNARNTHQAVTTFATVEFITARTCVQLVVTILTIDDVCTIITKDDIVTILTINQIVANTTVDHVAITKLARVGRAVE